MPLAAAPPLRQDMEVISLVGLAHGASHFFQLLLPSLFPWLMLEFGLGFTQAGALSTAFYVTSGTGQAAAGFLVDRLGARRVLASGVGLFGLAGVVLGDTPSLREQWEGAALFVDPDDPELLRRILSELTERPAARSTLGELARARARTCSPERMAQGYLAAYRELREPLGPGLETASLEP